MSRTVRRKNKDISQFDYIKNWDENLIHLTAWSECFKKERNRYNNDINHFIKKYKSDCVQVFDSGCNKILKRESNKLSRARNRNELSNLKKLIDYNDFIDSNKATHKRNYLLLKLI